MCIHNALKSGKNGALKKTKNQYYFLWLVYNFSFSARFRHYVTFWKNTQCNIDFTNIITTNCWIFLLKYLSFMIPLHWVSILDIHMWDVLYLIFHMIGRRIRIVGLLTVVVTFRFSRCLLGSSTYYRWRLRWRRWMMLMNSSVIGGIIPMEMG